MLRPRYCNAAANSFTSMWPLEKGQRNKFSFLPRSNTTTAAAKSRQTCDLDHTSGTPAEHLRAWLPSAAAEQRAGANEMEGVFKKKKHEKNSLIKNARTHRVELRLLRRIPGWRLSIEQEEEGEEDEHSRTVRADRPTYRIGLLRRGLPEKREEKTREGAGRKKSKKAMSTLTAQAKDLF